MFYTLWAIAHSDLNAISFVDIGIVWIERLLLDNTTQVHR